MPNITGGRVVYARTVQPAQYESKRVETELAFVLADGEDPAEALSEVGKLVKAGTLELLQQPEGLSSERSSTDESSSRRRRFNRRSDDADDEAPF